MRSPLSRRFYQRPCVELARALLGTLIVRGDRVARIVETEAYLGPEDGASHARFGPGGRSRLMFGDGGFAYVYLIYGMYDMFNVVAGRDGEPGAVLVRAAEPVAGLPDDPALGSGPGKLCRALSIERSRDNGTDLTQLGSLYLARGPRPPAHAVAVGPRVGVDYAGDWASAPLRFWLEGSASVSRAPRPRPRV
jgi:DNA-3-methyladenine glycosylase